VAIGGKPPTVEQRVERLEIDYRDLDERVKTMPRRLMSDVHHAIDDRASVIERNFESRVSKVEVFLVGRPQQDAASA
jgi:hypothetical protein